MKNLIKNELKGWKAWEIFWLLLTCAIICVLSIYWKDTAVGIVSAVAGVACVVCTGKGKLSAYLFGLVNVVLYAYISFQAKYYGEVMLNVLYYFPMQFYGLYVWKKHMNQETHEVQKRNMSKKSWLLVLLGVAVSTIVYGFILRQLGGALPFVDALSTVISVFAMIISIHMYVEQWLLWLIVDAVSVVMWGVAYARGSESIATLIMWVVYLANAVIMYIKWQREVKRNEV